MNILFVLSHYNIMINRYECDLIKIIKKNYNLDLFDDKTDKIKKKYINHYKEFCITNQNNVKKRPKI